MRPRDQKTVITKAIRRYIVKETLVKKITLMVAEGDAECSVIVTPNSNMLVLSIKSKTGKVYSDRVSIPRFSDYIVKMNAFSVFMAGLKPVTGAKDGHKSTGS